VDAADAWAFLPVGYAVTILIETPVLLLFLAYRHGVGVRLLAGIWLTACSYPVVVLVLPMLFNTGSERITYLLIAETFAPLFECGLFLAAFGCATWRRDCAVIVAANLLSFGIGEWVM
jgi:hypothetical protein